MNRVVALAGRRIDAPGAPERFPLRNRDLVAARVALKLRELGATAVVASAACGSDLIGHQAGRALGLRTVVVLPFEAARFRDASVTDRPGDWGPVMDDVLRAAERVHTLTGAGDGDQAYRAVNRAVLERAAELAQAGANAAIIVWEGAPRGADDLTADLAAEARNRGWPVEVVLTR